MRSEGVSTYVSIKLADGGRGRRGEAVETDPSIISHPLGSNHVKLQVSQSGEEAVTREMRWALPLFVTPPPPEHTLTARVFQEG